MSAQATVFAAIRPKVKRGAPQQSIEISFLDSGSWIAEALQSLSRLEGLPTNWDSYGGESPQPPALQAARMFLASIASPRVPAPAITAVPDGGVGFHWKFDNGDLEIECSPGGSIEFLRTTRNGNVSMEEGTLRTDDDWALVWKWLLGT
jgi:hypothetical protein